MNTTDIHNFPIIGRKCYIFIKNNSDFKKLFISFSPQVKYSEIAEPQHVQHDDTLSPINQKSKSKEFMESCNISQAHMKQSYPTNKISNTSQNYSTDALHAQYVHKDPSQVIFYYYYFVKC